MPAREPPLTCWSCKADVAEGAVVCPACGKLQPPPRGEDHFAALGIPRAFAVDAADLERRFRERSRQLHPDRFARAEPRERRLSLERTTRLNDALRALRDWRLRAAYLLRLEGVDVLAEGKSLSDPEFLEEQLEWREQLAEAASGADHARLAELAARAGERLREIERAVARSFEDPAWATRRREEIARGLARARYYENVVAEAERAAAPRS
jgi:molecular chaperone HscB